MADKNDAIQQVKELNEALKKGVQFSPEGRKELAKDLAEALAEAQKALRSDDQPKIDQKDIEAKVAEEVAKAKAEWEAKHGTRLPHAVNTTQMAYAEAITTSTKDENIRELQKRHDEYVLFKAVCDAINLKAQARVMDATKSKAFARYEDVRKAIYSTGTGTGDEWVTTQFSSMVQDRVDLETVIWQGLPQITIPQGYESITIPVPTSTRGSVYLQGQPTTDNPAQYRASTPGTDNLVLDVKTLASRHVVTQHAQEDIIFAILPWMQAEMVTNFARALDDAAINGDATATHQDSDVTDPTDHRKGWDGFREIAADDSATTDLSTAVSAAEINTGGRKVMGKYGINPMDLRLVCSISGYIALLNFTETLTVDKFGQGATILTGELGKISGIPIIVSEFMRDNLNASGVYDGSTTTRTGFVLYNVRGFARAVKRELSVQSAPDIVTGVTNIVGTMRCKLHKIRKGTSEKCVSFLYNHTA